MSNRRYYERRDRGECPDCGEPARPFTYCAAHRKARNDKIQADRTKDRDGYNLYMRVYKSCGR